MGKSKKKSGQGLNNGVNGNNERLEGDQGRRGAAFRYYESVQSELTMDRYDGPPTGGRFGQPHRPNADRFRPNMRFSMKRRLPDGAPGVPPPGPAGKKKKKKKKKVLDAQHLKPFLNRETITRTILNVPLKDEEYVARPLFGSDATSSKRLAAKADGESDQKLCESSATPVCLLPSPSKGPDVQKYVSFDKSPPDQDRLSWLVQPHYAVFFSQHWEARPLHIQRKAPNYYSELQLSSQVVDRVLAENVMYFGKHVDVTTYTDGVRETHNPFGRALPHVVWDFYKNGCSVRLLNPQAFVPSIHRLSSELQERFGFVGANLYLTPANSQGFAPHWDDIEAFVLQIEGQKHWTVYQPQQKRHKLPRYSSANLTPDELGPPCLECVLEPGDLLYFPRGFVHQARATDHHSLHITLSAYQCTAFIDLLELLIPSALKQAALAHVGLRQGLPLNCGQSFGVTRLARNVKDRTSFTNRLKEMCNTVISSLDLDSAIDDFAARKLHDQLPPWLSEEEKNCTVFGNRTKMESSGRIGGVVQLQLDSSIRLLSLSVCRLIKEEGKYHLYYSVNNSLEYHERDREYLELSEKSVPGMQALAEKYPEYMQVNDLPFSDNEEKWSFANSLWELAVLRTDKPLEKVIANSDDEDDDDDEDGGGVASEPAKFGAVVDNHLAANACKIPK